MRIAVKLFAVLRERAGVGEFILTVDEGQTVAGAVGELSRRFPRMSDLLPRVGYAVNCEYVPGSTVLREGDELALIPPVSGG